MKALAPQKVFVAIVVIVVGAAVTAGLVLVGSPADARIERLDARRVEDLQRLSRLIDVHWAKHGRLPASLEEIASEPRAAAIKDPVSGQPYQLRLAGEKRYELCAVFDRPSTRTTRGIRDEFWAHPAGRGCFPVEVKVPERF